MPKPDDFTETPEEAAAFDAAADAMIARLIRVRDKLHVAGISSQDSTRIAVAMLPGLPQLN